MTDTKDTPETNAPATPRKGSKVAARVLANGGRELRGEATVLEVGKGGTLLLEMEALKHPFEARQAGHDVNPPCWSPMPPAPKAKASPKG